MISNQQFCNNMICFMEKCATNTLHIIQAWHQNWAVRKFYWSRFDLGTRVPNWYMSNSLLYCFEPELQFISIIHLFVWSVTALLLITKPFKHLQLPSFIEWRGSEKGPQIRLIIQASRKGHTIDSPPSQGHRAMLIVMSYIPAERSR